MNIHNIANHHLVRKVKPTQGSFSFICMEVVYLASLPGQNESQTIIEQNHAEPSSQIKQGSEWHTAEKHS